MQTDLSKYIYSSEAAGHTSWPTPQIQSDGTTANNFHIGRFNGSVFKARLNFTIPQDLVISESDKLVINLKRTYTGSGYNFKYSRAFLSEQKIDNPQASSLTELVDYVESYYYKDINKETRIVNSLTNYTTPTIAEVDRDGVFLIFNKKDFQAGKTYYIYLYPYHYDNLEIENSWATEGSTQLIWSNTEGYLTATLYHESYTKVSPPTIELASETLTRDGAMQIQLMNAVAGSNNPILKYRIYYNNTENVDLTKYIECTETESIIYNASLGNLNKGNTVFLWGQTIGSIPGFDSDYGPLSTYEIINSAPSAPLFDTSGLIANSRDTDITIQNLRSIDINEDSLSYYYKIGFSDNPVGALDLSEGDKITLNKNNNRITVWAWDGESYGEATQKEIALNIQPEIISIDCTGKDYLSLNGLQVLKLLNGSAMTNKENLNYTWKIKTTSTDYKVFSSSPEFSNIDIQSYGKGGEQIYILLKVTDELGDSAEIERTLDYYLLPTLNGFDANIISTEQAVGTLSASFFNKTLSFTINLPTLIAGGVNLSSCKIYSIGDSQRQLDEIKSGLVYGQKITREVDTSNLTYGQDYHFKIEIIDVAGQVVSVESATYTKLGLVSFPSGATCVISPKGEWNIYNDYNFAVSAYYQQTLVGQGLNQYSLQYQYQEGLWKEIIAYKEGDTFVQVVGDVITFTPIDSIDFFRKFDIPSNVRYDNVKYRIIIKNAFGAYSESDSIYYLEGYSIETRQAPALHGQAFVRYGYKNNGDIQFGERVTEESLDTSRYFHAGEYLSFLLTEKATDTNSVIIHGENTITRAHDDFIQGYKIEYSIENQEEWQDLITIASKDLSAEGGYENCRILIDASLFPQVNKKIYFRIFAIDDTGLLSNVLPVESYMIFSRKSNPTVLIDGISFNEQEMTVKLSFSDFGGNNKTHQNFTRSGSEVAKIEISYGPSSNQLIYKKDFNNILLKELASSFNLVLKSELSQSDKIYAQVNVTFYITPIKNSENVISNSTPTFVYYSKGPTVSYRTHWVGINNTANREEDVIQISSYGDRKKIRLTGEDGIITNEIIIDLTNGRVTGISFDNVLIDGGQW